MKIVNTSDVDKEIVSHSEKLSPIRTRLKCESAPAEGLSSSPKGVYHIYKAMFLICKKIDPDHFI